MLKDTILWFVASGLALAYSFDRSSERGWFRSAIASQLGIIVLIEYVATAYTFSLPAELALQPVLVALGLLHAVSETDSQHRPVTKLTGAVLSLAGFLIVGSAIYQASQAIGASSSTIGSIALPAVLATAFLPAAYCLHLAVAYESLFLRLRLGGPRDKAVVRYAKLQLMKALRFDVRRVRGFSKTDPMALSRVRTRQDVDDLLRQHGEAPFAAS
jgi:peptidoglycan/LPS O-acetylase OafA/YrhL